LQHTHHNFSSIYYLIAIKSSRDFIDIVELLLGVFSMQTCPHCSIKIRLKELPYQGLFNSFRICPNCGGEFTVDTDTKYRQAAFIVILLISLVLTILLYCGDSKWLIPALVSYVVLGLLIYWGNKKLFFVPYQKGKNATNDT
jgi:uncharacterized protein (DUF983 family)